MLHLQCNKSTAFTELQSTWREVCQAWCKKELRFGCIKFDFPVEISNMIGAYEPGRGVWVREKHHYVFGHQTLIQMTFK